jgi:hypothetical protein
MRHRNLHLICCSQLLRVPSLLFAFVLATVAIACTDSSLTSTNPTPTKCQVAVSPATLVVAAAGGAAQIQLAAQQECDWTAAPEAAWITGLTPAAGQGNAMISIQVAPNAVAATRRGNVRVGSQTVVVTQEAASCTYSLTPTSRNIAAAGGSTTFDVGTLTGCAWTATSDSAWLQITNNASGTAPATVTLTAAANAGAARTGRVSVAGQTFTVAQAGVLNADCTYAVAPTAASSPSAGGPGSIAVTTQAGCVWAATASADWITIAEASQSGVGSGSVAYTVAANATAAPRAGAITIANQSVPITQTAPGGCSYSLSAASQTVSAAGGPAAPVTLTTGAGCAWTVVPNAGWITLTSPASGSGPAVVTFSVNGNLLGERVGSVTIGGQTHTVTQTALLAPQCNYSLNPTTQSAGAGAATGLTVAVTATNGCTWNAASNSNWITITSGNSGTGNGTVTFSVLANSGPARPGTLTIANLTATVNQASGCTYSIDPTSRTVDKASGNGSIAVTASAGCSWTATSSAGWLTVNSATGSPGSGSVTYSYQSNSGNQRDATISIANLTFTLTQKK